jgi:hypothetical protein
MRVAVGNDMNEGRVPCPAFVIARCKCPKYALGYYIGRGVRAISTRCQQVADLAGEEEGPITMGPVLTIIVGLVVGICGFAAGTQWLVRHP